MLNTLTITAKTGPGLVETTQVYNDVTELNINLGEQEVQIVYGLTNSRKAEFDLYGIATVTYTIATHSATIAFS